MVVFGHSLNVFLPAWTGAGGNFATLPEWAKTIVTTPLSLPFRAHFAVLFFFVHSGFVLSYRYFTAGRSSADLASAAARRYFRLALPATASILVGYVALKAGAFHQAPLAAATGSGWLATFYQQAPDLLKALAQGFHDYFFGVGVPPSQSYNAVLWTITTEFKASFLVFGLVGLFGALRHRWIVYLVCAFVLRDTPYLPFVLGVALCDLYTRPHLQAWLAAIPRVAKIACALAALFVACWSVEGVTRPWYAWLPGEHAELVMSLGAAALVFAVMTSRTAQGLLDRRPFRLLGELSYSVYLLHLIALFAITPLLFLPLTGRGVSLGTAGLLTAGLAWAATFGGAMLFRRYVDLPSIAFGKRVFDRVFKPAAPVAAVESEAAVSRRAI
jgi:peptidoglycan/LPS O-acetylase OafA/YrhL